MIIHGFGHSGSVVRHGFIGGVQGGLPSVTITGGSLSVNISGLPQISEPQFSGGTLQATISGLPTISDVRTQ